MPPCNSSTQDAGDVPAEHVAEADSVGWVRMPTNVWSLALLYRSFSSGNGGGGIPVRLAS
jgi:hypothetical protein